MKRAFDRRAFERSYPVAFITREICTWLVVFAEVTHPTPTMVFLYFNPHQPSTFTASINRRELARKMRKVRPLMTLMILSVSADSATD